MQNTLTSQGGTAHATSGVNQPLRRDNVEGELDAPRGPIGIFRHITKALNKYWKSIAKPLNLC